MSAYANMLLIVISCGYISSIIFYFALRSKKDCMRRYKELAEIVRAKKAAMAAAAAAGKS